VSRAKRKGKQEKIIFFLSSSSVFFRFFFAERVALCVAIATRDSPLVYV
jgi:hypothetical protein